MTDSGAAAVPIGQRMYRERAQRRVDMENARRAALRPQVEEIRAQIHTMVSVLPTSHNCFDYIQPEAADNIAKDVWDELVRVLQDEDKFHYVNLILPAGFSTKIRGVHIAFYAHH
jgi:hypothetical protein